MSRPMGAPSCDVVEGEWLNNMPHVLVQLLDADANDRLAAFIVARSLGVKGEDGVTVNPMSMAACFEVGAAVADFLRSDGGVHKVHIDGPGAETTIYRFKIDEDIADTISRYLASCAGFQ
jgi:hypothetical protein